MEELKAGKFKVAATLVCIANWSSEMNNQKDIKGPISGPGLIGNALWKGVRLSELLTSVQPEDSGDLHCEFVGADDFGMKGEKYSISIPLDVCMDPKNDFVLAYEMNG